MMRTTGAALRGLLLLASLACVGCGGGYGPPDEAPDTARASFAYVTHPSSGEVSVHQLDRTTGALGRAKAGAPAGTGPLAVAAHPGGRFLYVANLNSFNLSEFRIDPDAGTLAPLRAPFSTGAGRNPLSVAVHPAGQLALVGTLFDRGVTGKVTSYVIDPQSGALTPVGEGVFAGLAPQSMAIAPSGRFVYVADALADVVWTLAIDTRTGALTPLNANDPAPTGGFPAAVAVHPTGQFAYVVNNGPGTINQFAVHPATGALTPTGTEVATGLGPTGIAIRRAALPTSRIRARTASRSMPSTPSAACWRRSLRRCPPARARDPSP
jgi:DNA-binding beta-propeller fold protein YncE